MQAKQLRQIQWLTFRLSGGEYALDVGDVVEVLRMAALARVPEAPPWLAGLLNLRGRVIPVIDLRLRLSLPAQPVGLDTPIIVAQWAERPVGFIVDEVTEVLTLFSDALSAPDALTGVGHPVLAVARADGRLILLLDLKRICEPMLLMGQEQPEAAQSTSLHADPALH